MSGSSSVSKQILVPWRWPHTLIISSALAHVLKMRLLSCKIASFTYSILGAWPLVMTPNISWQHEAVPPFRKEQPVV